jgi:hypothetical protein
MEWMDKKRINWKARGSVWSFDSSAYKNSSRATRIEVFSDGELWHIIAYIPEGCDHVSHT